MARVAAPRHQLPDTRGLADLSRPDDQLQERRLRAQALQQPRYEGTLVQFASHA
jgi:hypothetical protein